MSDTDLTKMTNEELSKWQHGWKTDSHQYKDAQLEFDRRSKLEQQELDNKIIDKQIRVTKFSIILASISTLCAAILGAWAQGKLIQPQEQKLQVTIQIKTEEGKLVHYKVENVKVSK